jgi:hypothetical protein
MIAAYSLLAGGPQADQDGRLKDMNATDTNAVPEEKDVQTRLKSAARVVDRLDPTRGDDPDVPAGSVGARYVGYVAWLPPDASPIPHPWGGAIAGNRQP